MAMNNFLTVRENENPIYTIYIEKNFDQLKFMMETIQMKKCKICIVTDTTVSKYYLKEIRDKTEIIGKKIETFIIPPGEAFKNLETVNQVYEFLIKAKFDRNDLLIALGGGVVGDLTGFVAATYLRGIRFIQIPTTLLSMVDSSIGGKTGVDFLSYKNMIGAFHQPKAVYVNLNVLNTLTRRQYLSGFGEIIKYGLIRDVSFYDWLQENKDALLQYNLIALEKMIYESCHYKQVIVEKDPTEKGERALLNFGHTIGHAIEKLMNFEYLHGECVSIGMVGAAHISAMRGLISKENVNDIVHTLKAFELPTEFFDLETKSILSVTKKDKKMNDDKIQFILLNGLGNAIVDNTVSDAELCQAIEMIRGKRM